MAIIKNLNVYPVKSCKPISVQSAALTASGFLFDRQWMIVREDTGKFITQRQMPKVALIETALPEAALLGDWDNLPADACLTITVPGCDPVPIPLALKAPLVLRKASVWEWTGEGADEGDAVAACLSKYLGVPARLVRYVGSELHRQRTAQMLQDTPAGPAIVRVVDNTFAVGFETSFCDGFPVLLTSEASMSALNGKMASELSVNRFRGNIVVEGGAAWEEDTWRMLQVVGKSGGTAIGLEACKPCSRCTVPTVDQSTAERGEEPLDALNSFRSGVHLGYAEHKKSMKHEVFFGVNLVPRGSGVLSVGDSVECTGAWSMQNGFVPAWHYGEAVGVGSDG